MKYNSLQVFICVVFILTNASCTKTQDVLPSETHVGSNTIGFKVNGKVYTASGNLRQLLSFGYVDYNTEQIDSSIFIKAANTTGDNKFEIWLSIKYRDTVGAYLLTDGSYKGTFFLGGNPSPDDPSGSNIYYTNVLYTGTVTIKYFDGKFTPYNDGTILSGTFEMDGENKSGTIIHVTEGRFDIGN